MDDVRRVFDGYDTGVRYADDYVGRLLNALADQGVLDDTAILISSDHGECLGELNIYGDHQTADQCTTHIPAILRWPGITDRWQGQRRPGPALRARRGGDDHRAGGRQRAADLDGASFAPALRDGRPGGRDYLVVSQGAWSCQRSVRFANYLCIRSYHDGYHGFPERMLFDLAEDPHEQHDLAPARPNVVGQAMTMLDDWLGRMMTTATHAQDPMWTVIQEGGPLHTRGHLPAYLERLRATGRGDWADRLTAAHPKET